METKRGYHSCVFHNKQIFAIGGNTDSMIYWLILSNKLQELVFAGATDSVEIYDLRSKKWSDGPKLPAKLSSDSFSYSQALVSEGKIMVIYRNGDVLQMKDGASGWEKINKIESNDKIVFPAPIVTRDILNCWMIVMVFRACLCPQLIIIGNNYYWQLYFQINFLYQTSCFIF